jgi:hypothetical protein
MSEKTPLPERIEDITTNLIESCRLEVVHG